jgi:hypothetical protein
MVIIQLLTQIRISLQKRVLVILLLMFKKQNLGKHSIKKKNRIRKRKTRRNFLKIKNISPLRRRLRKLMQF